MRDPSKMITPKAICKEKRAAILDAVRSEPTTPYRAIAERFGVGAATVNNIAKSNGVRRKQDSVPTPKPPKKTNRREGGIIADDAQWRARSHRIGGC